MRRKMRRESRLCQVARRGRARLHRSLLAVYGRLGRRGTEATSVRAVLQGVSGAGSGRAAGLIARVAAAVRKVRCGAHLRLRLASWRRVELRAYVENSLAQASASWPSRGSFQRQIMPQAAQSFGQPRPISPLVRAGRPCRA